MPIYFYVAGEKPYGCFSNFSAHGFELEGQYWATCEHYFQAQKFIDPVHQAAIRRAASPKVAASLGRSRERPLRADWEQVKEQIMRQGVQRKFETHQPICAILLDTGDEVLIENSPHDSYWGCGKDGSGQNKLGLILMAVRSALKSPP